MRVLLAAMGLCMVASSPGLAAEDCTAAVIEAFQKQRTSKAFSVSMQQPTAEGLADMTVAYQPPDRMLQTVKLPAMQGEQHTMLVGNRAFAGSDGAYEELLPQFTQSIVAEVASALGAPGKELGSFECLGKSTFEGKEYTAYRTHGDAQEAPDKALARTIYVDTATGLPAYNVVAAISGKEAPVLKAIYAYPSDLTIEAPQGAPMQRVR